MFEAGEFDVCTIIYNRFKSAMTQIVTTQQLIPFAPAGTTAAEPGAVASYEYEPDETVILAELLPRNLSVQIYRALLENNASEQGARLALEAAANQVRAVQRVTDTALTHLRLDDLLPEILGRVREALAADTVVILLLNEEGTELAVRAAHGLEEEVKLDMRIPYGRGIAGTIADPSTRVGPEASAPSAHWVMSR